MSSKALMHLKELIAKKTSVLDIIISNMQITEKFRQRSTETIRLPNYLEISHDGLIWYVTIFLELMLIVDIMKRAMGKANIHLLQPFHAQQHLRAS